MAAAGMSVFVSIGAKLLPSLNASASAAEKRIAAMGKKIGVAAAETNLAMKGFMRAAAPMASLIAAGGIAVGIKDAIGAGAEYDHELQALRNAGRTSSEVARAIAAANRTIIDLPTSTLAENIRMIGETTAAFGDYGHALENLGRNQKIAGLLGKIGGADATAEIGSLIRLLEMRGAANDPTRYARETELAYQAIAFTKGKATGEGFRQFGAMANPLVKTLSDRYLYRIAPSLMTEFTPDQAGTMHQSLANTILGKVGMGGKTYAEGWRDIGLLDMNQAKLAKNGSVRGWNPGAIAGTNTFMRDPLAWAEEVLLPALRGHGVNTDDKLAMQVAISKLVGKTTAARLLGSLTDTNDRKRLHKDEGFAGQVVGVDRAYLATLMNDPTKGAEALKASVKNLGASLSAPVLLPLARALVRVAEGIDRIAVTFQKHPGLAKAVGGLGVALGALSAFEIGKSLIGFALPLRTLAEVIPPVLIWLRGAAVAFELLSAVEGGAGAALAALAGGATAATGGIALLAIAAAGVAFVIFKKWDGIVAFVKGFFEGFTKAVMPLAEQIGKLGQALAPLGDLLITPFKPLLWLLGQIWDFLGKIIAPPEVAKWHNWGEAAGSAIGGVVNHLTGFVEMLTRAVNGLNALLHIGQSVGAPGASVPVRPPYAPHRARGGSVTGGSTYAVNENGDELFVPGRSGTIIPARATAALIAAMSGGLPAAASVPAAPAPNATFYITSTDPAGVRREVRSIFREMEAAQRSALHD